MTVKELIKEVLEEIGAYGIGESIDSDDENKVFVRLNLLLEQFSGHRSLVHREVLESFSTVASQGSYTIGADVTADINTVRPMRISRMYYRSNNTDKDIDFITGEERADISEKLSTGTLDTFYYDPNAPLATIEFYPIPDSVVTVYVESWKQLPEYATLTDNVDLPPGYKSALIYNLAVDLADSFGKSVTAILMKKARDSRKQISMVNSKDVKAKQEMSTLGLSDLTSGDIADGFN